MKKKLLHLLIPFLAFPSVMRADEQHSLIISFHEGDSVAIVLADKPRATFIADSLHIETPSFSTSYLRSAIANFHFGWYDPTGTNIDALPLHMVRITYTDNHVQLLGIAPTSSITVHNTGGSYLAPSITVIPHGMSVDLTTYPAGIYLITINNRQTIKITKQ